MDDKDYLKDITEIKDMMNKSSRFISLSGLSGILAGIYALIAAYLAKFILANYNYLSDHRNPMNYEEIQFKLIVIAVVVAFLSIVTAFLLTKKKAKQHGTSIWDSTTKRLLFNFLVPLLLAEYLV